MFIFHLISWFSSSNNHWTYTLATERTVTESSTQMVEVLSLWDHGTAKFASLTVSQERNMVQWSQVMQGQSGVSTCVRRKALSSAAAMTLASGEPCIIDIRRKIKLETDGNFFRIFMSVSFWVFIFIIRRKRTWNKWCYLQDFYVFAFCCVYIFIIKRKKGEKKGLETDGIIFMVFVFVFCCVHVYIFIIKRERIWNRWHYLQDFSVSVYIYPKNEW